MRLPNLIDPGPSAGRRAPNAGCRTTRHGVAGPRVPQSRRSIAAVAAAIGLILASATGWAETREESNREYAVKAAFIRQFAKFVDWPEGTFKNSDEPVILGVLGQSPFGSAIEKMGDRAGERNFSVKYFRTIEDWKPCHILFICPSETDGLEKILDKTRDAPVLVIGDTPGLAAKGAVINFIIEDNKVRFEVNLEAAKQAHLQISSKVLRLARLVGPGT